MATKKQHYIPQMHLRNFSIGERQQHVFVLEKSKSRIWKSAIIDAAEENYFYKLNISEAIKGDLSEEQINALNDACIKDFGKPLSKLTEKELEKIDYAVEDYFAELIEPRLKYLMDKIIINTYSGNRWVIEHCLFINEEEKHELSWFLAKEFIRTKHHREQKINMLIEMNKKKIPIIAQFYGMHIDEENISISYSKEQEKLLHANEIFDEEITYSIASVFNNHIWVLLENFTDEPFCCSDNLFTLFPTYKLPAFYGYGLATYGITIWYPISSKMILVMMDRTKFETYESYKDKRIIPIYDKKYIENINYDLVAKSYKYSYFSDEQTAKKYAEMCAVDENLRTPASLGHVY